MRKLFIVAICFTCLQASALAAEPKLTSAEERIKEATDKCMLRVSNGQADDALNYLLKEFWNDRPTTGQATVGLQREYRNIIGRAEDALGQAIPGGYDFVGAKRLGSSVLKLVYLQKNELAFLPWVFSFYKASEDWKLTHITFPNLASEDIRDLTVVIFATER